MTVDFATDLRLARNAQFELVAQNLLAVVQKVERRQQCVQFIIAARIDLQRSRILPGGQPSGELRRPADRSNHPEEPVEQPAAAGETDREHRPDRQPEHGRGPALQKEKPHTVQQQQRERH